MNRKLKAEIIRKVGAQYPFAATLGIRESTGSAVVRGNCILDDQKKREWSKALGTDSGKLFSQENHGNV